MFKKVNCITFLDNHDWNFCINYDLIWEGNFTTEEKKGK